MTIVFTDRISVFLKKDTMLQVLVCIIWAAMLLAYMRGVVNHLPGLKDHAEEVQFAFVALTVSLSLPALVNKFCLADYLFYLLNVSYYLFCFVFFPENTVYLTENAFLCLCCVLPFYFIGRIIDIDKLFNVFILLSTVCIYMTLFYYLVYAPEQKSMKEVAGDDNMYTAYQILPHIIFMLWTTLEKFRLWKIVTTLLGILFLLSCGTRGPFVCLGAFGIIYFFFYMNFKGAIYLKLGIVSAVLITLINLKDIIYYLAKTLTGLQLSTRILEKIVTGELGNDSYRSVLRDKLYSVLDDGEHFWGLGMFGCRNYDIIYPHFLPLDFFCTYGYFVGTTLLILLFVFIGWAFAVSRSKRSQVFILLLTSISIIKLLISGSFTIEPYFYMLIGVCVSELLHCYSGVTKVAYD